MGRFPGEGNTCLPTSVLLPGASPRTEGPGYRHGVTESDTHEQLSTAQHRTQLTGSLLGLNASLTLQPVDCSPPGSSVHGILQARRLEWVAISFSRGPSQPRDQTQVSCMEGRFFYRLRHQGSSYSTQCHV